MSRRAAVYARISLDRRDGEGVARQLADCRALVAQRGWDLAAEYVDNDVSAFRANRRPEWDRLIADLDAGTVDALVAHHPDRTYRRAADLEALIDVVERTGAEVATVKTGDIDLASATGRMGARIVAAVSRHESERIGERVARAKSERAAQGRPSGGGVRAFGYELDKVTLVPDEARQIAAIAGRVAAGGSVGAEARRLNLEGYTTTAGRPWDAGSLRRVLTSARIAGLRAHHGEVVGPAVWPAIIDEGTWRRICVMVEGRKRGRPAGERWLLSALIGCPKCGKRLYAIPPDYRCCAKSRGGCGGASISIRAADAHVSTTVDEYLADDRVPGWLEEGARPVDLSAEVDAIEQKQVELANMWARGAITTEAHEEALKILQHRLDTVGKVTRPGPAVPSVGRLRRAWSTGSNADRRAVIVALVEQPIELRSGRMSSPGERLTVTFREE